MTSGALTGRVAVITGASSGIGAAVATALAGAGASVTLGARREDRLRDEADAITAAGGRAAFRVTDVTRRAEVEALIEAARAHHGPVDILVCNAGVMPLSPLVEGRVEDWEHMVDVNVKGVLYGLAAVLPEMVARRTGHVVTIGSVAGRRPFPGGTVYSATKFAVRSLVAGLQLELSSTAGIRVTDVQPGVVDTELAEHIPDPERRREFLARWAARRSLRSDDVAAAVLHAVTAPAHVNVNEILLRPTDQPT